MCGTANSGRGKVFLVSLPTYIHTNVYFYSVYPTSFRLLSLLILSLFIFLNLAVMALSAHAPQGLAGPSVPIGLAVPVMISPRITRFVTPAAESQRAGAGDPAWGN